MKVFLIGATGFTGRYVLDLLLEKGYKVTCLVRKTSVISGIAEKNIKIRYGDISDFNSLVFAAKNNDALIYVAHLSEGFAFNIIECCKKVGINRLIFTSSTGIFTNLKPAIKEVKLEAERLIKESGLQYTIIRPTMIYGTKRDRNMCKLIEFIRKFRAIPIIGDGKFLQQPVYVENLAQSYLLSLNSPNSIYQEYNIAGGKPTTYNEIIDITARMLNKKIFKIHVPLKLCIFLLSCYEKLFKHPRLTKEQALRLNENKEFSIEKAKKELGYTALTFEEGMEKELLGLGYI